MILPSTSRRRLLRTGGTLLGAGVLSAFAGCSSIDLGGLGTGGDTPEYATWLPAPSEVLLNPADAEDSQGEVVRSYYPFVATDWNAVGDRLEAQGREAAGSFEAKGDDYETEYEDGHVHPVLSVGPRDAGLEVYSNRGLSVLETGMDDEAVVEAFETRADRTETFESAGEYEGWTLLSAEEAPWTVGVRDGTLVEGFQSAGFPTPILRETPEAVKAILDARNGEGRYVDANADLEALLSKLGTGTFVTGATRPAGLVEAEDSGTPTRTERPTIRATGEATRFTEDGVRARYAAVFASAEGASVERVTRNGEPWRGWEGVETEVDGRVVVAEGSRPDYTLR
jgi:hypothetical protein